MEWVVRITLHAASSAVIRAITVLNNKTVKNINGKQKL